MDLMTTKEVSELLRVNIKTVRNLIENGSLPAFRFGKDYRLDKNDVMTFITKSRVTPGETPDNNK